MLDGTYSKTGEGVVLSFERRMDRPIEKIWAVLTVPERIADWMGEAEIEPHIGGRFRLRFYDSGGLMEGTITAFEPPRLFEHTWNEKISGLAESRVRWTLEPDGDGCRVALTHTFPSIDPKNIVEYAGGWDDFLDLIPIAADGTPAPYRYDNVDQLTNGYAAKFGIDPALARRRSPS